MKKQKLIVFIICLLLSLMFITPTIKTKAISDLYGPQGNPVPSFQSITNPVPGYDVNSKYGEEPSKSCIGIKIGKNSAAVGSSGPDVVAATRGTVVKVGYKDPEFSGYRIKNGITSPWYDGYEAAGRGNYVIISHGIYDEGWEVTTGYYHLWDVVVKEGDRVGRGTKIGTVGSTGDTTETCLCFEVMSGGNRVNPELFMPFFFLTRVNRTPYSDETVNKFAGKDLWKEERETVSLATDWLNKTFDISINDGADFYRPGQKEKRIDYNNKIREDNNTAPQISLYDRFGGSLSFIPYYGEKKFNLSIIDTLYEKIKYSDDVPSFSIKDLFTKRTGILINEVYTNRPEVISEEQRSAGVKDPRVEQYSEISATGGSASLGNMYLGLANFIVKIIMWLSGNGVFKLLNKAWEAVITSGAWKIFSDQLIIFLPLISIFFIVFLVRSIYKLSFNNISSKKIVIGIANYLISVTFIFYIATNPKSFSTITTSSVNLIDNLFASVLSASGDEVSQSSDLDLVTEAAIWKQAILDPWCKGMFNGREYSDLYTKYEPDTELTKWDQSSDNIFSEWSPGEYRYNSMFHTGDIKIPIGNGKVVRNWAALAWSTQSAYHINAVEDTTSDVNIGVWPYAETTPKNQSIYVDNFRWIDAKLNISPKYLSPDSWVNDYSNAKSYSENFIVRGMEAVMLSLLLLPLLWPIIKRLICLTQIVIICAKWMVLSLRSIIFVDDTNYSPLQNIKRIFKPLYHYFWWSMIMFIIISMYLVMTNTFLGSMIYLTLSIVIILAGKPIDNYKQIRNIKKKVKSGYNNTKDYMSKKISRLKD